MLEKLLLIFWDESARVSYLNVEAIKTFVTAKFKNQVGSERPLSMI
jgi:hypothetical protein